MIPEATRKELLDAMERFDRDLRLRPEWSDWERRANYKYAISHSGRLYPVKQIISLAVGSPVRGFKASGATSYMAKRGFSVVSLANGDAAETIDIDVIQGNIESILSVYASARIREPFGKNGRLWTLFSSLQRALSASIPIKNRPTIKIDFFAGRNSWASMPFVSIVDLRQTESQSAIHCALLFRQDMSGFYLALMLGSSLRKKRSEADLESIRSCLEALRRGFDSLKRNGFALDDRIDLRSDISLGKTYESAAVAHKFYKAGSAPDDGEFLQDLNSLLQAYEHYLTAEPGSFFALIDAGDAPSPSAKPDPSRDAASAAGDLIKAIASRGFVFEPWQVASYLAALRTKPFVILAGVSGTGKSKLPALVASLTGGESHLLPVKPDWTDSSDVLGYRDLRGVFRPGPLLEIARRASRNPNKHFVCILDEMNLARVEHYFAEVLSRIEDRRPSPLGGFESGPLLAAGLDEFDAEWSAQGLPPNLAIAGTVNMDESAHGFSRKVLDRAFTIEFSDVDLASWESAAIADAPAAEWPVSAWHPRALRLGEIANLTDADRDLIRRTIEALSEINRLLAPAQLQIGYRSRDETALFALHAEEISQWFATRSGERADPLDLALHMKTLPRLAGGGNTVRRAVLQLLGWAYCGKPFQDEQDAEPIVEAWRSSGIENCLKEARYPRTAARLCLMWERLQYEGFTSFWL